MFSDWTIEELTGFRKELAGNIALGVMTVRYADRTVTYMSLKDMLHALALIDDEIKSRDGRRRVRQIRPYAGKGYW